MLLKKILETGSTDHRHESGGPKHWTWPLWVNCGTKPGGPHTNTSLHTRYPQSIVARIVHRDLGLKCFFFVYENACLLLLLVFLTLIFRKVVQRRIHGVVGYIIITLLQIVYKVCQWKKFEIRSIIGENMDKSGWHVFNGVCTPVLFQCFEYQFVWPYMPPYLIRVGLFSLRGSLCLQHECIGRSKNSCD